MGSALAGLGWLVVSFHPGQVNDIVDVGNVVLMDVEIVEASRCVRSVVRWSVHRCFFLADRLPRATRSNPRRRVAARFCDRQCKEQLQERVHQQETVSVACEFVLGSSAVVFFRTLVQDGFQGPVK